MIPVVTPDEMRAVDAAASVPVDVLIERAGAAVARAAIDMLGGSYGRRVVVIAGSGNNGADGRVAARRLEALGVRVRVIDALQCPPTLPSVDLVIDAAFGTGFRGNWHAPDAGSTPVLAVDLPSGLDPWGRSGNRVLRADRTVTFAALKPALLFADGAASAGRIEIADIGLTAGSVVGAYGVHLVEEADVSEWLPHRRVDAHKWNAAVRVVAGSRDMPGAAALASAAALRTGAGLVQVSSPDVDRASDLPVESLHRQLVGISWADEALNGLDRFHALVLGPGLGRADHTAANTRTLAVHAQLPVVIDGDGLFALAWNAEGAARLLRQRDAPTILTPHDGEHQVLTGALPGPDRITAARRLAADTRSIVLLKGPTTVVADPEGEVLLVRAGDERLATAGTGDVLAGIIGALLARRVPPLRAAAMGAYLHGLAAGLGPREGLLAGDLPALIPVALAALRRTA